MKTRYSKKFNNHCTAKKYPMKDETVQMISRYIHAKIDTPTLKVLFFIKKMIKTSWTLLHSLIYCLHIYFVGRSVAEVVICIMYEQQTCSMCTRCKTALSERLTQGEQYVNDMLTFIWRSSGVIFTFTCR